MFNGQRLITLLVIVVLLNPSRIEGERSPKTREDSKGDGDLMSGIARAQLQERDNTHLKNDVTSAFEHAQHHHLHERQVPEKQVIHHAEEPGQEDKEHGLGYHHSNPESGSNLEKGGEIHVEALSRRVREDGEEKEDHSGEGDVRRVEIRDIHYHTHKVDPTGETPDDEDSEEQFSGENSRKEKRHFHQTKPRDDDHDGKNAWEHFDMHLHSHGGKEGEGDFGYVTDEEEEELPEDSEDGALSGERGYDHKHLKTLHVHQGMPPAKKPRDHQVDEERRGDARDDDEDDWNSGEAPEHHRAPRVQKTRDFHVEEVENKIEIDGEEDEEDEFSGEEEPDSAYERRDVHLSQTQDFGDKQSEKQEASLPSEKQEKENESGKDESSGGEQGKIPEENNEGEDLHKEKAKSEKEALNQVLKSLSGKKEHSSGNKHGSRSSQKLQVNAKIHLTHHKVENRPLEGKITERKKSKVSVVHKAQKHQKPNKVDSLRKDLNKTDDFYIVENDEPKEKLHEVEMMDIEEGKEIADPGKGQIKKRTQRGTVEAEAGPSYRRGPSRHLLQFDSTIPALDFIPVSYTQCTHPAIADKIPDDVIVYIRAECRLCQCRMGALACEPKPQLCDQQFANKSCIMERGEEIADGDRHFDGCNNCFCRNGELLCTRIRCRSANYNYTDYRLASNDNTQNVTEGHVHDGHVRGKDPCLECDYEPMSLVCGPNWKTYRSMCHAMQCAGLKLEHVKEGDCEIMNPCDEATCAEHEICLARRRGPCLAGITTDGDVVQCQQYQCVNPTQNCSSVLQREVCGEDHTTYTSECAMFARGIALAYYGPCKEECVEDDTRMCGVDGVTLASSCHATLLNSHADYPGGCDQVEPKNNVYMSSSDLEGYYNRRCKTVHEFARCPDVDCTNLVIPEGSCCRACGIAISIRLDTAARDMTTLKTAKDQPSYNLNRLSFVHNSLKTLSNQFGGLEKCQLTTDLVDTNDISVVYKPIKTEDADACEQVAVKTVEFINSPAKNDVEPGQAIFAAAVVVEQSEVTFAPIVEPVTSVMVKRRKKRTEHHEHEPFYNQNERICPRTTLLLFLVILGLYWTTNLSEY